MSSAFADRFRDQAMPLLRRELGEVVRYRPSPGNGPERDLPVLWRRADPAALGSEGLGIDTSTGAARATVAVADLPEPDGQALLRRGDTWWGIDRIERIDAHTWLMHLAVPDAELRLPAGMRG